MPDKSIAHQHHATFEGIRHVDDEGNEFWLARPLAMPAVYVVGQQTDVIKPADLRFIRRRLGMQVEPAPGSHLFPLEYPLATADLVARLAAGW